MPFPAGSGTSNELSFSSVGFCTENILLLLPRKCCFADVNDVHQPFVFEGIPASCVFTSMDLPTTLTLLAQTCLVKAQSKEHASPKRTECAIEARNLGSNIPARLMKADPNTACSVDSWTGKGPIKALSVALERSFHRPLRGPT